MYYLSPWKLIISQYRGVLFWSVRTHRDLGKNVLGLPRPNKLTFRAGRTMEFVWIYDNLICISADRNQRFRRDGGFLHCIRDSSLADS